MPTIINPISLEPRPRVAVPPSAGGFRKPKYDCQGRADEGVTLTVYVPGVEAAGVGIEARGPDLTITARKTRFVRVNWQALHLESAQRDYRLRLRLGVGFAYRDMQAEISQGVLTITLPKRQESVRAAADSRLARVA